MTSAATVTKIDSTKIRKEILDLAKERQAEVWKPVPSELFRGRYEVSSLGRVRAMFFQGLPTPWRRSRPDLGVKHFKIGRILKPVNSGPMKYHSVRLVGYDGKIYCRTIHRLVLEAFRGPRLAGKVSRHLNGNRYLNLLSNLKWGTQKQNTRDAFKHGTISCGSNHPSSKLTEKEVLEIRNRCSHGERKELLAEEFNVSASNIYRVVNRELWKQVL